MRDCEIIRDDSDQNFVRFLVVVNNEQAGIANFEFTDSSTLWCSRIKLHEEFRGKGYSKKLLQKIVDYARANKLGICLEISPYGNLDFQGLLNLYESYGFKFLGNGTWLLDFRKHNSPVS